MSDLATLGQRIRHFRTAAGLTLDQLGAKVDLAGSQLSLIENGKREPRVSQLSAIAAAVGVQLADLLDQSPPTRRAALEIELDRAQRTALYSSLGLPLVRPSRGLTDETLTAIVGLHRELGRRAREAIATPEQARRGNTELRRRMRELDNSLPELDELAEKLVADVGHERGAITHREVSLMAERIGFQLVHVPDLPALGAVGHRPGERADLPAARLDPRRSRAARHGAAGHGAPPARAQRARELRRLPAAAARDQLLRRRSAHAAQAGGRRSCSRRRPTATSRSRTSATRSA